MNVRKKMYDNGMELRYIHLAKNRPATLAIMIKVGSKDENAQNNGISHLIEHMAFKGTKTKTSKQINTLFDELGVMANAFTTKRQTFFHTKSLDEKLEDCFEILSDIVYNPAHNKEDLEKERKVVLEEMANDEDDPMTLAYYKLCEQVFEDCTLAMPVIGSAKTVEAISQKDIAEFHRAHYVAQNTVVAVATNKSIEEVEALLKKYIFKRAKVAKNFEKQKEENLKIPQQKFDCVQKDFVQQSIMLGFVVPKIDEKDKIKLSVLNFALAGGMSSRLFQKLREEHGLVYSVFSSANYHENGCVQDISLVTSEKNAKQAVQLVKAELDLLKKNGISNEELERAKMCFKTSLVAQNEKSSRFAIAMAGAKKTMSMKQRLREIEELSTDDIQKVVQKCFEYDHMCGVVVAKEQNKTLFDCFKA